MTHPPKPTTMTSRTEPTPETCWASHCRQPARARDLGLIPKYCGEQCEQRTVADHQVVIDGKRPAVYLHPGPLRVTPPAPPAPPAPAAPADRAVGTDGRDDVDAPTRARSGPDRATTGVVLDVEARSVPELIVDAYLRASARLRHGVFGRGGR